MQYENLKIDIKSFATSRLSFTLPVKDIKESLPYDYGDPFLYAPDGKTVLFYGTVTECARNITDGEYTDSVTVSCLWDKLSRTIYVNKDKFSRGMIGAIDSCDASEFATEALKNIGVDVDFKPVVKFIPFFSNCQTLEWILLTIKRSQPNLTSYWDYSSITIDDNGIAQGQAKLCFSLFRNAVSLVIGKNIKSISCAQSKQQSNGVILRYAWTDRNGRRRIVEENAGGLDYGSENVTVLEVSEEGVGEKAPSKNRQAQNKMSLQTMTIKGIRTPKANDDTTSKKYWDIAEPRLKDINVKYGAVQIETVDWQGSDGEEKPANYVNEKHGYAKIEGEIHAKTRGIKHCRGVIRQAVRLEGAIKDPSLRSIFDQRTSENKAYGWLESDVTLIDRPRRTYIIGGNYEYIPEENEEEPEPEPEEEPPITPFRDIATQMHDGTIAMGWSGDAVIIGADAIKMIEKVGSHLCIIGSDPRWRIMRTPIQTVSYEANNDSATIRFGLPDHIEVSDQQNAQEPAKKAEDTTALANDPNGWSFDWSKENEDEEDPPDAPNIGGNISGKSSATVSIGAPGFQVRAAKGEDGKELYQVAKGTVYCPNLGQVDVGEKEWNGLEEKQDEVWLVCSFDRTQKKVTAGIDKKKPDEQESEDSQYIFIAKIDRSLGTVEQGHIGDFVMKHPLAEFPEKEEGETRSGEEAEKPLKLAGIIKEVKEGEENAFLIKEGVIELPRAQSKNTAPGIKDIGGLVKGVNLTILPKTSSASERMQIKDGIIDCDLKMPEDKEEEKKDYADIGGGAGSSGGEESSGGTDGITRPSGAFVKIGGSSSDNSEHTYPYWKDGTLNIPLCTSFMEFTQGYEMPVVMGCIANIKEIKAPAQGSSSYSEPPMSIVGGEIRIPRANTESDSSTQQATGLISSITFEIGTHTSGETPVQYARIKDGVIQIKASIEIDTYPNSRSAYSSVPWDIE